MSRKPFGGRMQSYYCTTTLLHTAGPQGGSRLGTSYVIHKGNPHQPNFEVIMFVRSIFIGVNLKYSKKTRIALNELGL